MKRLRIKRILAFSLPLVVAGVSAYIITIVAFGGTGGIGAAPGGPPSPEKIATVRAELDRQKQADDVKLRYFGKLGDFEVVASDEAASPASLCRSGVVSRSGSFVPSELNKPEMSEQLSCADGTIVATYSATGRRSYFVGTAKVAAQAPLDRLKLLDVDGHSALAVEPPTKYGPYFIYVIQRPPSASSPGIMLGMMGGQSLQSAIDAARLALSQ